METPLPWKQLTILLWINFSEALTYTMCLPFVPFMVQARARRVL